MHTSYGERGNDEEKGHRETRGVEDCFSLYGLKAADTGNYVKGIIMYLFVVKA